MLGGVVTKMAQMVGSLKTRCIAKVYQWSKALLTTIAYGIDPMIQSVRTIKRVFQQWITRLNRVLFTIREELTSVELTPVRQQLGLIGFKLAVIVLWIVRLVMRLLKRVALIVMKGIRGQ